MEADIKAKVINDIIEEYCSAEYKSRYNSVKNEIDNSEPYLMFNEEFDETFGKIASERTNGNRGYFV